MALSVSKIEEMAPDQGSLTAARKLVKPSNWPALGHEPASGLVWGECQGSGANPYRVVGDANDLGYKCTCPSRKFPCKHALALFWLFLLNQGDFVEAAAPEWATEWSGRRRPKTPGGGAEAAAAAPRASASLAEVEAATPPPEKDEKALERAAAQSARLKEQREAAILAGLEELDRWLLDQVDRGLAAFLTGMYEQCRLAARRLVDAKAPGLAGRIDQIPATLLALDEADRPQAAMEELGQIALLSQAYRRLDRLPQALRHDVRRLVGWTTTKEEVLNDPDAVRVAGTWQAVLARTELQVDNLQRVETWFRREAEGDDKPEWALLVDYHPASAGTVVSPFTPGDRIAAEIVFYPSAAPIRALIAERIETQGEPPAAPPAPPAPLAAALDAHRDRMTNHPWLSLWPIRLTDVHVAIDANGLPHVSDGEHAIPVARTSADQARLLLGLEVHQLSGLWDGRGFLPTLADTSIGRWVWRG